MPTMRITDIVASASVNDMAGERIEPGCREHGREREQHGQSSGDKSAKRDEQDRQR